MARKTANGDEAAAVAAAIARFEAEVGAALAATPAAASQWQRAALIEGVSAKQTVQDSEGGARWLS
ncbi:MAG TPA: hypothetical protein VH275_06005 [Solirubrobacterales bacterium]|nr:hypothetical protein [Solirubrobacterales bacterium]